MALLPLLGSQKGYWHCRQRTKAPWVWGGNVRISFHRKSPVWCTRTGALSPSQPIPTSDWSHSRLSWWARGLQKLRWSPEHWLHCLVDDTSPGCVLHTPTCSASEISAKDRPPAGCRMLPVTRPPGPGLGPDCVFSCRDLNRERKRESDLKTHMDGFVSFGICSDSDKTGYGETWVSFQLILQPK